uniref:Uncharacterized protein n=1 Tax=Arion vulgaris TaxID=1028688 RepID=A0A0B6XYI2_9EUPU
MGKTSRSAKAVKISERATGFKSSISKNMKPSASGAKETSRKVEESTDGGRKKLTTSRSRKSVNKVDKIHKETYKLKKISAATVSKWQNVSRPVHNSIMLMLEDNMIPFTASGNDVEDTLDKIRVCVRHTLQKIKLPKDKCMDDTSLKSIKKMLLDEKTRLEDLESTLKKELRQLERLNTE